LIPCFQLKEGGVVSARPEITVENVGPLDFFVIMASDGVWDVLSDQVISLEPACGGVACTSLIIR